MQWLPGDPSASLSPHMQAGVTLQVPSCQNVVTPLPKMATVTWNSTQIGHHSLRNIHGQARRAVKSHKCSGAGSSLSGPGGAGLAVGHSILALGLSDGMTTSEHCVTQLLPDEALTTLVQAVDALWPGTHGKGYICCCQTRTASVPLCPPPHPPSG